jgi:FkbM family methyltransferase
MDFTIFTNDDSVKILLIDHNYSKRFKTRDNHEVLFRRINTFLIKNNFIKKNIIDLGAWIGDNSIPWAMNIEGIVYAIDPSADNLDFINKTCKLNNITNVKTIEYAISNINETLTTFEDIHHCSFIYGNPGLNGINKVKAVSLDYLYNMKIIDNVDYIHLDVEGMEYKILEGSIKLIEDYRPIITFEQHLEIDNYNIILSFLNKHNYTVFLINEILPGCRHDCRNSIAFPNEIDYKTLIENINNYLGCSILERQ